MILSKLNLQAVGDFFCYKSGSTFLVKAPINRKIKFINYIFIGNGSYIGWLCNCILTLLVWWTNWFFFFLDFVVVVGKAATTSVILIIYLTAISWIYESNLKIIIIIIYGMETNLMKSNTMYIQFSREIQVLLGGIHNYIVRNGYVMILI